MVFSKKYCPVWVYDCVVSQSVSDFILYGVDLPQPCKKFAGGLSELFEGSLLKSWLERLNQLFSFWLMKKLTKIQLIYSLIFHTIVSICQQKTRRKFGGIFGTKLSDDVREYSGNETLKNLKAYYYETRSDVAIFGSGLESGNTNRNSRICRRLQKIPVLR